MDALLSTVMMPGGIPVVTVGVDNAKNAALLALQILALSDESLFEKMELYREKAAAQVLEKDHKLNQKSTL